MEYLVTILIAIAITFGILLVCRELNCWYLKINERRDLLKTIIDNQETIIWQLKKLNSSVREKKINKTEKPTPVIKAEEIKE